MINLDLYNYIYIVLVEIPPTFIGELCIYWKFLLRKSHRVAIQLHVCLRCVFPRAIGLVCQVCPIWVRMGCMQC